MTHRWVMLTGTSPGAGKTTLSEGLTEALRGRGLTVDLIQEEAIFERSEFEEAGRAFKARGCAAAKDLIVGYERLVAKATRARATVVFDWSAAAMAEDLPWAADQEALNKHVRHVKEVVTALRPVTLFLNAPLEAAIDRATAQRGAGWLAQWAGVPTATDPGEMGTNRARALTNIRDGSMGTERNRAAFVAADWPMVDLDASRPASGVLGEAVVCVLGERSLEILE